MNALMRGKDLLSQYPADRHVHLFSEETLERDLQKSKDSKIMGLGITALLVLWLGFMGVSAYQKSKIMEQGVQPGFADPSKLERVIEDRDHDGRSEVYFRYGGEEYSVKVDEQDRLILQY